MHKPDLPTVLCTSHISTKNYMIGFVVYSPLYKVSNQRFETSYLYIAKITEHLEPPCHVTILYKNFVTVINVQR